jgi:hypothetical protein
MEKILRHISLVLKIKQVQARSKIAIVSNEMATSTP